VSAVADDHEVHLGSPRLLAQYLRGRTAENPRLDRNSAAPQGARDLAEHPGVALLLFLLPGRDLHFQLRGAERFVEKPHFDQAVEYVGSGQYRWNAGMFIC